MTSHGNRVSRDLSVDDPIFVYRSKRAHTYIVRDLGMSMRLRPETGAYRLDPPGDAPGRDYTPRAPDASEIDNVPVPSCLLVHKRVPPHAAESMAFSPVSGVLGTKMYTTMTASTTTSDDSTPRTHFDLALPLAATSMPTLMMDTVPCGFFDANANSNHTNGVFDNDWSFWMPMIQGFSRCRLMLGSGWDGSGDGDWGGGGEGYGILVLRCWVLFYGWVFVRVSGEGSRM
ncbi:hypothetical protein Hypma_009911 [Hypsizygus marmoreus]|uniref:Uncharacterized protein n=1 Tax=Hypsizygus marmoreus TaxID=39966 RepID=A0A369JNQ1_HYPMA|nr:hypothetical protein Hypma_009911 [Hypsizygus marmoreus]